MTRREQAFTDAEFTVVRGPYRIGEEHRRHRGWFFTGRYDQAGDPLFQRGPSRFLRALERVLWTALLAVIAGVLLLIAAALVLTPSGHDAPPTADPEAASSPLAAPPPGTFSGSRPQSSDCAAPPSGVAP